MPFPRAPSTRIGPCVAVLATVVVTALGITIPAYRLGQKFEDERRFLKAFRIPNFSGSFIAFSVDYAAHSAEPNDVVFVGGSTCLFAVQTTRARLLPINGPQPTRYVDAVGKSNH